MTTNDTTTGPEQLRLLPADSVPLRFRLDDATRRRGLRHVAEIRARLDAGTSGPATSRPDAERRTAA